ncbi:hypothetical protein KEM60_03251 [Austwickia sp. TVS 96-490-7B]|uniref:restriction endonuclease subunit S n=1 Tax=Austwickia sp. TVS 96-490-7B TaxID=2830843 RepID=UPI001C5A45CA|nr:restriction endonuclease subunit S [Austwickia sp. TVS 96-490-7B]MBW3087021.1 hypothetical protein [Austwickia sp. TVS 96-490-7B]
MKPGWTTVALGEICELKYGKALAAALRVPGAYPVFGSNGQVGNHDRCVTSGPTIIVGRKGSFGEVNYSEIPCWPIDTTYYIDRTATKQDLRWLRHVLPSLRLTELNRAAAVPGLNRDDAYGQRLLLPPLEEQRRIAAILDHAAGLRVLNQRFVFGLNRLSNGLTDWLLRQGSHESVALGDASDIQGGLQVSGKRAALPVAVPYLRVANIGRGHVDLSDIKMLRVTQQELNRVRLQPDDLLLVEGHGNPSEVGRAARWDGEHENMVHQNHLIRVRATGDRFLPVVLEALINSSLGREHFTRFGKTTSGLNTISTSNVRSLILPVLSKATQSDFAERSKALGQQRERFAQQECALSRLGDSLQARAFSGGL